MKTKLRTTYLVTVLFFLFVTVGSMILFYNMFSEEFIIANNKKIMNSVFEDAQGMDLSSLTKSDRKRLKEFSDKGGVIAIYDGEKIIYFSGDTPERKKNIKRRKFDEKIYEYTYTPKANVSEGRKAIRLKGKIDQNVKTYYLYCSVKLRTLENSIGLISRFMLVEMIIILILGIPFSFYMAQRTVKPIEKLGKLAKKMENNEPINFEEYDFPNNEIGNLSDQMKSMYLKISSNLNELNNYNYLLKTQNKELIEFDERRKKFIGAATHELKTPLAIISTQLEMMNMDNDEAMSEYYESIMEEIQKMSNLIREMLNSSFEGDIILSGPMKVDSLSELLDGMKDKYMGLFWSKKVNCRFDIEDNIYINMNNEQIEQAINNYIINAYEHIPEKGTAVVTLKSVDDKAVISVFNNGNNIKEEELSKIWEGFYQTDERAKESNVGLGLYIVRNIVKNHNGVYYAKNHHNGVEFVMEFNRTDKY